MTRVLLAVALILATAAVGWRFFAPHIQHRATAPTGTCNPYTSARVLVDGKPQEIWICTSASVTVTRGIIPPATK